MTIWGDPPSTDLPLASRSPLSTFHPLHYTTRLSRYLSFNSGIAVFEQRCDCLPSPFMCQRDTILDNEPQARPHFARSGLYLIPVRRISPLEHLEASEVIKTTPRYNVFRCDLQALSILPTARQPSTQVEQRTKHIVCRDEAIRGSIEPSKTSTSTHEREQLTPYALHLAVRQPRPSALRD